MASSRVLNEVPRIADRRLPQSGGSVTQGIGLRQGGVAAFVLALTDVKNFGASGPARP